MAAGTRLVLEFADSSGQSMFFSFNYGNASAPSSDVKAAMNTIINNGSIFKRVPVRPISAQAVVSTTYEFDLSD